MANLTRGFEAEIGGLVSTDGAAAIAEWIQALSDRRGRTVEELTQLCGEPASGKPVELWLPEKLDTPEKCRSCWGADPFARIAIKRPPLRALRFLNTDGAVFQVAFEAQIRSGQWLAINDWYDRAAEKFGDQLWLDWVKPAQRSHLGKYLSPVGEGKYRPVWTPDFSCTGKPIDWSSVGANKKLTKNLTEGPWKGIGAWFDLGLTPIVLAGVDAAVIGAGNENAGELRPELAHLLATGVINVAFDKDTKPATVKRVSEATARLVKAIGRLKSTNPKAKTGRTARVIQGLDWPSEIGGRSTKGIDDLVQVVGVDGCREHIKTVPIGRLIARGRAITITKNPNLEIDLQGTESLATYADQIWAAFASGNYRNIAIYAPTGAGKTETVKAFVNGLVGELASRIERSLVYLSPRVSLNESEAKEFDATPRSALDSASYLCESTGKYVNEKIPPKNGRITMCLEGFESISIAKFFSDETVFFCDEFDQTLDQAIDGGTLKGKVRAAYDWLSDAFCASGIRIIASAGLRDHHIDWLQEMTGDDVFLVSAKRTGDGAAYTATIDCGKDFSGLIEQLEKSVVENGDRVMLAWDNRRDLTATKEYFDRKYKDENGKPKYRFLIATRETSADPEIKDLISRKGEFLAEEIAKGDPVHVLGFTTTLGTGWSLKDPDPSDPLFSNVFGISSGTIAPEGMRQMLNRFRLNCPRTIWAKRKSAKRGRISKSVTTNGVIYELVESRRRAAKATNSKEDFAALEESGVLEERSPFLKAYSESVANDNATRELSREVLAAKLQAEGRVVHWTVTENDRALKDGILEVKDQQHRAWAIALYNAPKLTLQAYLDLERKEAKTKEDYISLDRFKFDDYYLLNLSDLDQDEAINFALADNHGNRRSGLRQLSRVLGKYHAMHVSRDVASIHRAIEDRAMWEIKHDSAISNLFAELRFSEILELGSYTAKTPLLKEVYDKVRSNKKLMGNVRRWLDSEGKILNTTSPTAFVNAILRGIDVEVFQDKESKTWEIDQARLAESVEILDRQFARWQQQTQQQNQPEPVAPETQATQPEPIAHEPEPTVIRETKPAPDPIEFWTTKAGKYEGKKFRRAPGKQKPGKQLVQEVGKFGTFNVDVDNLIPWQEPIAPVAVATQAAAPVADIGASQPTMTSPIDRANHLWDLWEQGAIAQAAATIRGWFKEVDTEADPLGLSSLKTAVCSALPGLDAFWIYALQAA